MSDASDTQPSTKIDHKKLFDLEAQEATLSDFQNVLTTLHPKNLESWVMEADVRQSAFANLAVGQIRWLKSLGRPDVPQLAAGFVFDTQFWIDLWHIGIDGTIVTDHTGWARGTAPSVWDGPEESDYFSVRYLFYAADQNDNLVEVRFSEVNWKRPGRHVHYLSHGRYLNPPAFKFYSAGKFTALPDIDINPWR